MHKVLTKIKNFYIRVFIYIGSKLKQAINFNRRLVQNGKDDWSAGYYGRAVVKLSAISIFIVLEIALAIVLLLLYIGCKLTGVCLLI